MLLMTLAMSAALGCRGPSPPGPSDTILVYATIPPLVEFIEAVGGTKVEVHTLVPEGGNPHTFTPKPSAIKGFSDAGMFVKVGTALEFETAWAKKLHALNRDVMVVNASRGLSLMAHDENGMHEGTGGYDPHVWLSPANARVMVANIHRALVTLDPPNAAYYTLNLDAYLARLTALDRALRTALVHSGIRTIVVYHPSWAYFSRDFGLSLVSIERGGKEPSLLDMVQVLDEARGLPNPVFIASHEFSSSSARVVANELGCDIIYISPLMLGYIDTMTRLAKALSEQKKHRDE